MYEDERYKDYEEPGSTSKKSWIENLITGNVNKDLNLKGSGTRNLRIYENSTPWSRIGTLASGAVFLTAIASTIMVFPLNTIISLYMTSIALFIGFDGMNIFGRVLAPQSRYLISGLIVLYSIALFVKLKQYYLVLAITTLIIYAIIKLLNVRLLDNHNYLMTPAIQQAINDNDGTIVISEWNNVGKRDVLTYARYQDLDTSEKTVEASYRGIWSLGYLYAYRRMKKAEKAAEDATEECKSLLADLKGAHEDKNKYIKIIKTIENELEESKNRIENLESDLAAKKTTIGFYAEENTALKNDNETMAEMLTSENKETIDIKQSESERAIRLLQGGLSPLKVANQMGIPKTRVYDEYCPLAFPEQYEVKEIVNGKKKYKKIKIA